MLGLPSAIHMMVGFTYLEPAGVHKTGPGIKIGLKLIWEGPLKYVVLLLKALIPAIHAVTTHGW